MPARASSYSCVGILEKNSDACVQSSWRIPTWPSMHVRQAYMYVCTQAACMMYEPCHVGPGRLSFIRRLMRILPVLPVTHINNEARPEKLWHTKGESEGRGAVALRLSHPVTTAAFHAPQLRQQRRNLVISLHYQHQISLIGMLSNTISIAATCSLECISPTVVTYKTTTVE